MRVRIAHFTFSFVCPNPPHLAVRVRSQFVNLPSKLLGTFLSWLNFTVILGGLAVGLLNFGDSVGRISAGLFTLVAMATMIYALVTFHWRAKSIRQRGQGGFDDRFGPSVLAVALLAAVVVNFVLRITV